ncbi:sister chromatid cohesion protein Dcc1 [Polychytrium aggregatum]|uniref:sister chromatid cohesion protein Dcc1 n=1 Tax=Polychytrium aggregatum TaxID=110093 RepID=UPI0022FE6FE1|nr:sister chromatid cohesion protein Dcc1 [Polychytrium aggregatum]KAI9206981.1 sister chromatid cohesion protein Dcc1 [Polychytrium aggregatum]
MSLTISLPIDQAVDRHRYRLIELPPEVAALFEDYNPDASAGADASIAATPPRIIIKGGEDDEATLCTDTQTFAVKEVQTSNTLLMICPLGRSPALLPETAAPSTPPMLPYALKESVFSYIELIPCPPRLERLRRMLSESPYNGPDAMDTGSLYTLGELLSQVQASPGELQRGLKENEAFELEGRWRIFDPEFQEQLLNVVLLGCIEHDKQIDSLALADVSAMLRDTDYGRVSVEVIAHCLECFSVQGAPLENQSDLVYSLSREKISRFYGKQILSSLKDGECEYEHFLTEWSRKLSDFLADGDEPSLKILEDLCLVEVINVGRRVIKFFPKDRLSLEAKQRLEELFTIRKKWSRSDLLPYVSDLAPSVKKLDALLLKYTRMSKVDTEVFYTFRYALSE